MFNISKQADYGLIIISYLLKAKATTSLATLVRITKLPQRFLARIAATLVRADLLKSQEGRGGGYETAGRLKKISLYDYLRIFEGEVDFCSCGEDECRFEKICLHRDFVQRRLNQIVSTQLKRISLLDLFEK